MRTIGKIAVRLSFRERRICKNRGGDGLQCNRDTQLLHHVGFGGEVEVHLHRAGAIHHVEAHAPDLLHIFAHDLVAALGHHRNFVAPPVGREAEPQKADAVLAAHLSHLRQMVVQLGAGLMQRFQRRPRQLELATGLKRDIARPLALEADDILAFINRLPAEAGQPLQHGADAVLAAIGNGAQVLDAEGKFFVFRADPPVGFRLVAAFKRGHEIAAVGDGLGPGNEYAHGSSPFSWMDLSLRAAAPPSRSFIFCKKM